jgi:hypothetical protein
VTRRADLAAAVRPFAPGGKLRAAHIPALDALADALGLPREGTGDRLGKLSERYESGGRGPGTVSNGKADPGGVSYGLYQLASKTGTLDAFLRHEGKPWFVELVAGGKPGSAGFSAAWKAVAKRQPESFGRAQHAFIERTHYAPAVDAVKAKTGLDLAARHPAVRDAVWSTAVQHGGAVRILADAVAVADAKPTRSHMGYDEALLRAIYKRRSDYVRGVAGKYTGTTRASLLNIVDARYPSELQGALAMLKGNA